MTLEEIINIAKESMSEKRFKHSYSVIEKCEELAMIYGEEIQIEIHTTGDINMTLLDKILFVADFIADGRTLVKQSFLEKLLLQI